MNKRNIILILFLIVLLLLAGIVLTHALKSAGTPAENGEGEELSRSETSPPQVSSLPSAVTPEISPRPAEVEALPLEGFIIGLDAGHQRRGNPDMEPASPGSAETKYKVSSGTQGKDSGVPEYEVVLNVALLLRDKLEELGATVIMTREIHDVDISNSERALMMNDAEADLVLRIHADGSEDRSVHGASMLVPAAEITKTVEAESRRAGELILAAFLEATGAADKGVVQRKDLTGFNWSSVPVCLIELGFMTNSEEEARLIEPDYQELCAEGLKNGITAYFMPVPYASHRHRSSERSLRFYSMGAISSGGPKSSGTGSSSTASVLLGTMMNMASTMRRRSKIAPARNRSLRVLFISSPPAVRAQAADQSCPWPCAFLSHT